MTCSLPNAAPGTASASSAWRLHALVALLLAGPALGLPAAPATAQPADPALVDALISPSAPPSRSAPAQDAEGATPVRLVVVHWKIKQGQEQEFLDYWAQRSPVADRSGLVGEFLSSVEDRDRFPWINMQAVNASYTSFFNIGIWKNAAAFEGQIGKFIDNSRPSLPFEAERRERVFLQPERWRIGGSVLSLSDQPGVK